MIGSVSQQNKIFWREGRIFHLSSDAETSTQYSSSHWELCRIKALSSTEHWSCFSYHSRRAARSSGLTHSLREKEISVFKNTHQQIACLQCCIAITLCSCALERRWPSKSPVLPFSCWDHSEEDCRATHKRKPWESPGRSEPTVCQPTNLQYLHSCYWKHSRNVYTEIPRQIHVQR